MAITLNFPSGSDFSIQDDFWISALSTNSGQTDMKYVFDVYKNNQILTRVKLYPQPSSGRGFFNGTNIYRNAITYDWFTPTPSVASNGPFITTPPSDAMLAQFQIRVGEEVAGITTTNIASGNISLFNYSIPLYKRRQPSITIGNYQETFLSNRSKNYVRAQLGQKILIPFKSTELNNGIYMIIKKKVGNTIIQDESSPFSFSGDYIQLDIGSSAINAMTGFNNFINSSVQYYDVSIFVDGPSIESEPVRVWLECNPKLQPINLHFLNAWGMFETACFNLVNKLTSATERKQFAKKEWNYNGSSVDYYSTRNGSIIYNESKINYGNVVNWEYKLKMDCPDDIDYEWLQELMDTPQCYAELDGNYYPVTIKDTNYEYSKNVFNGLKTFELTIELNQTRLGYIR
jgi:hypothetical protein